MAVDHTPTTTPPAAIGTLWLDRVVARFGFDRLAAALPGDPSPSVAYALTVVVAFNLVQNGYKLATDIPVVFAANPYFVLLPLTIVGGAIAASSLRRAYGRAMVEMAVGERVEDPGPLLDPIPFWLPWGLFLLVATLQVLRSLLGSGWATAVDTVTNLVVFPVLYGPVVAQFLAVYVGIQVIAPLRIARSRLAVDFLDPEGLGGLRPMGELAKQAYFAIVLGLVAFALITYAPFVTSRWAITGYPNHLFTATWLVSVASIGFPFLVLHRFIRRRKRAELTRLRTQRNRLVEHPWDIGAYEVPPEHRGRVRDLEDRIDRVSGTGEFPATISVQTQLLLSVLLPKGLQLLIAPG